MFGSLLRDFEEDPFFSDPFTAHQEHVRQMMRSFSDPFGRDPFFSITDGRSHGRRGQQGSQVALREDHRVPDLKDGFHSIDNMMANMRNRMIDIHKQFEGLAERPDVHTFKSSSVMTYSKTGDEPPKIFHATSQTRKAPGGRLSEYMATDTDTCQHLTMTDMCQKSKLQYCAKCCKIKETKKAVRDSESGVEQIAVGHHLQDRAHIVKKMKNNKTGDQELNQEFLNMDESDAPSFDNEWEREISKFKPFEQKFAIEAPKHQKAQYSTKIGPPDVPRRERCISKMVI